MKKNMPAADKAEGVNSTNDYPVLVTLPEVCRLLSISKPTAYRMQKDGTLRPVHLPGRRATRYRRADVIRIVG